MIYSTKDIVAALLQTDETALQARAAYYWEYKANIKPNINLGHFSLTWLSQSFLSSLWSLRVGKQSLQSLILVPEGHYSCNQHGHVVIQSSRAVHQIHVIILLCVRE